MSVLTDPPNNRIHKVGLDGKVTVFAENTNGANGMMFGPDGRLYTGATDAADRGLRSRGKAQVLAEDMPVNDLAVNVKGDLYFTDTANKKVWLLPSGAAGGRRGIESPNGVLFSPDQTLLYVSDYVGQLSWVFQIQPDGSLAYKQRYFYVHMPDAATRSSSMAWRSMRRGVYIATALGVQVFDQIGKCHAIIPAPQRMSLSNVEFGGPNFDEMYVTNGDKVFSARQGQGRPLGRPAIAPAPRL